MRLFTAALLFCLAGAPPVVAQFGNGNTSFPGTAPGGSPGTISVKENGGSAQSGVSTISFEDGTYVKCPPGMVSGGQIAITCDGDTVAMSGIFARIDQATAYTAGAKQSVSASATTAGLRIVPTADPNTPAAGDLNIDTSGNLKLNDGSIWQRVVTIPDTPTAPGQLCVKEDPANGTSEACFIAPASLSANVSIPVPSATCADGTAYYSAGGASPMECGYTTMPIHVEANNPIASLADSTTYYFGGRFSAAFTATEGTRCVKIPRTGTIVAAYIRFAAAGGSNETSSLYIRINASNPDYLVSSTVTTEAGNIDVATASLTVPVTAGQCIEMKLVNSAHATDPTTVVAWGDLLMVYTP